MALSFIIIARFLCKGPFSALSAWPDKALQGQDHRSVCWLTDDQCRFSGLRARCVVARPTSALAQRRQDLPPVELDEAALVCLRRMHRNVGEASFAKPA